MQTTVQSMRSERCLSTIPHCLEWYKRVLRARLFTVGVRYLRSKKSLSKMIVLGAEICTEMIRCDPLIFNFGKLAKTALS